MSVGSSTDLGKIDQRLAALASDGKSPERFNEGERTPGAVYGGRF